MVRIWHPSIIEILDNNRILAAHSEVHIAVNALARGQGSFWLHPETQRFFGREDELRYMHDLAVDEMLYRGFKHHSPLEGSRKEIPVAPQLAEEYEWWGQDMADLWRKWSREERIVWNGDGTEIVDIELGFLRASGGFGPTPRAWFLRVCDPAVQARAMRQLADEWPDRGPWTKQHRERLRSIVLARTYTP